MNQAYQWQQFNNIGYITSKFSENDLKPLTDEIQQIQNGKLNPAHANSQLAGHIKKEYVIEESRQYVESLIFPLLAEHDKIFNYVQSINILEENAHLYLSSCWVNFQEKHEFNPIHNHSGIYSFVIWIKIPYSFEDEEKVFPMSGASENWNGHFQFLPVNSLGGVFPHKVKAEENMIIIFPSSLYHCVYPFYTSDKTRISVAGNFKCRTKTNV